MKASPNPRKLKKAANRVKALKKNGEKKKTEDCTVREWQLGQFCGGSPPVPLDKLLDR